MCLCGRRVERSGNKLQCLLCKQLSHLECYKLVEADLEFVQDSFKCKICLDARRKSFSSEAPAGLTGHGSSDLTSSNNPNMAVYVDAAKSLQSSLSNTLNNCHDDDNAVNGYAVCASIDLLSNEVISLKSLNIELAKMVTSLHEDNSMLHAKLDELTLMIKNTNKPCCCSLNSAASCQRQMTNKQVGKKNEKQNKQNIAADKSQVNTAATEKSIPNVIINDNLLAGTSVNSAIDDSSGLNDGGELVTNSSTVKIGAVAADVTFVTDHVGNGIASNSTSVLRNPESESVKSTIQSNNILNNDVAAAKNSTTDWQTVRPKRIKSAYVSGLRQDNELEVAPRYKWLHLSSFKATVSPDDILDYIVKYAMVDKNCLVCYKLIKKDVDASTLVRVNFKLGVRPEAYDAVMNAAVWPRNVVIKPFTPFRKTAGPGPAK